LILKEKILHLVEQYHEEVVGYRRHIHANPELAFEEYQTAEFVANKLKEFNIPFETGIAKTGIVALLEGKKRSEERKEKRDIVIALRADMDALPILEENDIDYKSKNLGKMHACGHDVHTASLLGVAKILSEIRSEFAGTVKFIFQPSEEKLPGGASVMIKEGVLENPKVDYIIAQHVYPDLEAGKVGFRPGMYMASADELHITIKGKGGHAALPKNVVNPLLIAAKIITELYSFFETKKDIPTIFSLGNIQGNGATNVVPNEVSIKGTFRTMDEQWRKEAHKIMIDKAEQIAKKMGGSCEFEVRVGYPCVINEENLTAELKQSSIDYLGSENIIDLDLRMTGEDFSYYSQVAKGCFYRLGTAKPNSNKILGLHTPTFNIDESALKTGVGLMSWLAIRLLGVRS